MQDIIRVLFIVLLAVMSLVMNMNLSTHGRSAKYLKEDLEIAVHDSSLFQDLDELSIGRFVFDENKARDKFEESLERNTGMTIGEYEILEFHLFDQSNSTFPVEFNASSVQFTDTFFYPSIVAIIETNTTKYFTNAKEEPLRRVASYSFKMKDPNQRLSRPEKIQDIKANENGFYWSVPYTKNVTSPFNPNRMHPIYNIVSPHNGIDIASDGVNNQPVIAVQDGTVVYAGTLGGYGNLIIINHGDGFETRYAHLSSMHVVPNQIVSGGQIIGNVGSTGDSTAPHLHFETRVDGVPIDPMLFY